VYVAASRWIYHEWKRDRQVYPGHWADLGYYLHQSIVVRPFGIRVNARARSDDWLHTLERHKPAVADWFHPRSGELVVEVGSHIGIYPIWAAHLGARVVAIEPNPDTYAALVHNIDTSGVAGILPLNVAIGDHRGSARLFVADLNSSHSSFDPRWLETHHDPLLAERVVNMLTLDEALQAVGEGPVDWLLVDVEGAELGLLKGAPNAIRRCQRMIIEVADSVAADCEEILRAAGLEVRERRGQTQGVNSYWYLERPRSPTSEVEARAG
jgi:FkbM family methyltransferase